MSKLSTVLISHLGKTVTGKTPSSESPTDFGSEVPFVTPSDSFDQKYLDNTERYLSNDGVRKLANKLLPPESVMVTCIGSAMGKVAMNRAPSITNQQINSIIVSEKYLPEYIYYVLRNSYKQLRNAAHGSTALPLLNKTDFDRLPLQIHSNKSDQQKIAAVLSALDAKIDYNNRINAELETMAKTMFEYWFVQFDFPNVNGEPYKSSGGKMTYNPLLKREIPEGWTVYELTEIINRSGTGLNPRDNFKLGYGKNYYVTIKNVSNGKIVLDDKCDRVDDDALKIIDRRSQLQPGDVLFTSIEPVGITYLIQEKPVNWNINESVFTIRPNPKKSSPEHLYLLLSSNEMKTFTRNSSSGSVHKGIRHGVLKTFKLAYGTKEIIDNFSNITKPILKLMYTLDMESQQLIQLRDWILPMLMNGQVQVDK